MNSANHKLPAREARMAAGLSPREAARASRVSERYLLACERQGFPYSLAARLSRIYGCGLSVFLKPKRGERSDAKPCIERGRVMDGTNPLVDYRERQGLSRAQLARRLGVSYTSLAWLESGYPRSVPESIRDGLRRLGADVERLAKGYARWRDGVQENETVEGA